MKLKLKRQLSWYYHNDYEKIQYLKSLMYDMLECAATPKQKMIAKRVKLASGGNVMTAFEVKAAVIKDLEQEKEGILAILLL